MQLQLIKTCTKCGEGKALPEFRLAKKNGRLRAFSHCLECERASARERMAARPKERRREIIRQHRIRRHGSTAAGRRAERAKAKGMTLEQYDAAVAEKRQQARQKRQRAEDGKAIVRLFRAIERAAKAALDTQAAEANETPQYSLNPRTAAWRARYQSDRAFRIRELIRTRTRKLRRRGRIVNDDGTVTAEVCRYLAEIKECAYCGCDLEDSSTHIEHITPLARGGINSYSNLIPSCADCNTRKSDRTLLQFIAPDVFGFSGTR